MVGNVSFLAGRNRVNNSNGKSFGRLFQTFVALLEKLNCKAKNCIEEYLPCENAGYSKSVETLFDKTFWQFQNWGKHVMTQQFKAMKRNFLHTKYHRISTLILHCASSS